MATRSCDVLLINPGSRWQVYQSLGASLSAIEPPVWAGLMASFLRLRGARVQLIDAEAEELSPDHVAERVERVRPQLAAVIVYGHQPSASTQNMTAAGAICTATKAQTPATPLILVGGHVAALVERTLREEAADFVCSGEGPYTLAELWQALAEGAKDFNAVRGLAYRDGDRVVQTPSAPLVKDLDHEMPGVAWDLLPMDRYRAHNWHCLDGLKRQPYAAIYTTLGCPYHCSFCCIQAPFKSGEAMLGYGGNVNSYRFWSASRVVDELELLVRHYGVRNVKIADEMFVLNPKHIEGICDGIVARGLDLNIWAYARVDTVRDGMAEKLKRAGFHWLAFGIEAANERVRTDVQKGFGQDLIFRTLSMVREAGINVIGNYIFGLPEDTIETMRETLDLAMELNCEFANFYCFVPGTPVYTPSGVTAIDEVLVGQEVHGLGGTTRVLDRLERWYDGIVFDVKPRFLPAVTVTEEHPFLVAQLQRNRRNKAEVRGTTWKQAKDLVAFNHEDPRRPYDAVMISKKMFTARETSVDFSPFVKGWVGGGHRGGQLSERGERFLTPWSMTEELAELFGWYLAEGYRLSEANHQIGFALCSEERGNINRVRDLVAQCFGYRTRVLERDGKCVVVSMTSKILYRALPSLLGHGAHAKRVPECLINASEPVTKAFLRGYVGGDGTSYPNALGQWNLVSCSETLAREVIWLFLKVGILPSYGACQTPAREIRGRAVPATMNYRLSWVENLRHEHYLEDDEHFYIPIKTINAKTYRGYVYNLKTENETYAVPFVVHNCAMAYPGSQLYQLALKEQWPLPPRWSGYSQHSVDCLPLPTRHLPAGEVIRFRDDAFQTYYRSPRYLEMVARKFGPETAEHLREMVNVPLKRQHIAGSPRETVVVSES